MPKQIVKKVKRKLYNGPVREVDQQIVLWRKMRRKERLAIGAKTEKAFKQADLYAKNPDAYNVTDPRDIDFFGTKDEE